MRKDYEVRNKKMGGGMMNKRPMMNKGGKLKMVTNKQGKKVPFYAADGVGKMKMNPAMMLSGIGSDPIFGDLPAGAKKGGRIMKTKKGGKAVRGFAKKKKQANKMRKK